MATLQSTILTLIKLVFFPFVFAYGRLQCLHQTTLRQRLLDTVYTTFGLCLLSLVGIAFSYGGAEGVIWGTVFLLLQVYIGSRVLLKDMQSPKVRWCRDGIETLIGVTMGMFIYYPVRAFFWGALLLYNEMPVRGRRTSVEFVTSFVIVFLLYALWWWVLKYFAFHPVAVGYCTGMMMLWGNIALEELE